MLTIEELEKIEKYLENKPAMKLAGFIKYLRNNWVNEVPNAEPTMANALKGVRPTEECVINPNKAVAPKSGLAKRGVYVRTEGDSALGDRK